MKKKHFEKKHLEKTEYLFVQGLLVGEKETKGNEK